MQGARTYEIHSGRGGADEGRNDLTRNRKSGLAVRKELFKEGWSGPRDQMRMETHGCGHHGDRETGFTHTSS